MKTLYYHASLITGDVDRLFLPGGYLLVDGDRIAAVGVCGDEALPEADVRHDLAGRILMPGMISSHCHFYGQFVRGGISRKRTNRYFARYAFTHAGFFI